MTANQFSEITQPEAALSEEIGQSPLELDYSEDGKIIDFLEGHELEDKPEERNRQRFIRQLHFEYGYPKDIMRREVPINMGRSSPTFTDIAVYRTIDAAKRKDQGQIRFCVEVKADNLTDGHNQLVSYIFVTSSEGAVWTNGDTIQYFRRYDSPEHRLEPWNGIPGPAETWDSVGTLLKENLVKPSDVKRLLKKCHQKLFRAGIESEDLAMDIVRIILAKWRDEVSLEPKTKFYATPSEYKSVKGQHDIATRIQKLFAEVRDQNLDVFESNEKITAPDVQITEVVVEMQRYRLLVDEEQWWDVLGVAYEQYTAAHFRQTNGQFFTNRLIVHMIVEILDPGLDDVILDPAGGSGGFVTASVRHLRKKLLQRKLTKTARQQLIDQVKRSVGLVEKAPRLVKIAKTAAILTGDGHENFHFGDSLLPITEDNFSPAFLNKFGKESPSIIMTNPPYAGTTGGKITSSSILSQYDVAKVWKTTNGKLSITKETIPGGVPPELLFLERCVRWLKPGGKIGIVMAQGMLDTATALSTRKFLFKTTKLLAVISLHKDSFRPYTGVQTCVLIFEKNKKESDKTPPTHKIFMSISRKIGQDSEGLPRFKRDKEGKETAELDHDLNEILKAFRTFQEGKLSQSAYIFSIKQSKIDINTLNINPQFYLPAYNESIKKVLQIGNQEGWSVKTIGTLTPSIFKGGRFRRQNLETLIKSGKNIEEFYTPAALLQDRSDSVKYLDLSNATTTQKSKINASRAKEGELLITRSGSVGRVLYVTKHLDGKLISDDLIHIRISDKNLLYYVYVVLKNELGQHQMMKNEYGSIQKHLEPAHIREVIIPIPDDPVELKEISKNVKQSIKSREKSLDAEMKAISHWQKFLI